MKKKTYSKEIYLPELKEFAATYPQFAGLASAEGKFLFDIVMKPETFIQAMILTEYGMPAVTSVAELCYNEARKKKGFAHICKQSNPKIVLLSNEAAINCQDCDRPTR